MPAPLAAGDLLLDRYNVVEPLGEGGHSLVYLGHDERLARPVCIKVFHRLRKSASAYAASYEHFIQEAFALSKLAHPSTLRIFDFGHVGDDGPPFQITELMNGGTLTDHVRSAGALAPAEVATLVTSLCGALSEAHDLGIVHRDIKPGNILLSMAGATSVIKLADFGIAKTLAPADADAPDGEELGDGDGHARRPRMYSRRWAAPEQMTSFPVTPASDLYSLALVAIFALTGRAVFKQRDAGAAYAERMGSDDRIDEVLEGVAVSSSTRALLKRACSFDPRRRPQGAGELGDALAAALHAAPAPPAPRAPALQASRSRRRRLELGEPAAVVGDHRVRIIAAPQGVVEVDAGAGVRLEIALVPAAGDEFRAQIKAVGGFIQRRGGRPARAVQLAQSGEVDIVAPNGSRLASARVALSRRDAGDTVLALGEHEVAIAAHACRRAILLDLGAAAESALVYAPQNADKPDPPSVP